MRKRLYILVSLIALAGTVTVAEPDGGVSSRIEAAASAPQVEGEVGKIVFVAGSTDTVFNVYSITGQLLKVVRLAAEQRASVDLPKGFYIVKTNNHGSRKVVVK